MLALYDATLRDGGATFDPRRGEIVRPAAGYAVALSRGSFATVKAERLGAFLLAIVAIRREHPDALIGTWLAGGEIHLDPVTIVADRAAALALGRAHGQLAVYDFETAADVEVAP